MKSERNNKLATIFKEMSSIYKYMGADERFRAISYSKASKVINNLQEDVSIYIKNNTLEELPGIGKSISEKIRNTAQNNPAQGVTSGKSVSAGPTPEMIAAQKAEAERKAAEELQAKRDKIFSTPTVKAEGKSFAEANPDTADQGLVHRRH